MTPGNEAIIINITQNINGTIQTIRLTITGDNISNLPTTIIQNVKLFDIKFLKTNMSIITNVELSLYKLN